MAVPYLTAAFFCEKVLEEKNGSLSAIRIADRVEVEEPSFELPKDVKPGFALSALVAVKSGPAKGKFTLKIVSESPSGKRSEGPVLPVTLEGGDHGQNFIVNFVMHLGEQGVYWFDVIFEEQVLTRIPLMVARKQPAQPEKQETPQMKLP